MREYIHLGILFRQILDYPDYWVSQCGRVLSTRKSFPCILKGIYDQDGYVHVGLYTKPRCCKLKRIHRLVWETWMNLIENHLVLNHLNGIKDDNRLENLEKTTQSGNVKHSYKMGFQVPVPGRVQHSKLKPADVIKIRQLLKESKYTIQNIADKFNVTSRTIYHIRAGEIWKQC